MCFLRILKFDNDKKNYPNDAKQLNVVKNSRFYKEFCSKFKILSIFFQNFSNSLFFHVFAYF